MTVCSAAVASAQPPPQIPRPFPQPPAQSEPATPEQRARRKARPVQIVPGAERWSAVIPAASTVPPVMTDTQVFAAIPPGIIAAYRAADGVEMWRVELAPEHPLTVVEGRLFVAAGEAMHALDAATGAVVWRQPTGSLTAPPLVQEGWIVTATAAEIVARRASDGTVVWQQALGAIRLMPTIDGDTLYLPLVEPTVRAVNLTNGTVKWDRRLGGAPSEIAALAGRVYVGSEDKYFYCLNARDGRREWRPRIGAVAVGRAAIDADRVYFAATDNLVRGFDRVDGALKWQAPLPYRPNAGPILFGTALVVPGAVAELQTLDVVTGKPGRSITLAAPLRSPLAIRMSEKGPIAATVTAGVEGDVKLSVFEPSMTIPIAPLSVLPGTAVTLPPPPPPGGGL